jgi:hypothetical protein
MLTENSRHVKNYQSNEHKNLSGNRFELRDHDGVLNRYEYCKFIFSFISKQ